MRIDRLYGITVAMLNHGRMSAAKLAARFEVSERTIRRDMDAIGRAGIPVAAFTGAGGGYELSDSFRLARPYTTDEDYGRVLTALRGLATATGDARVNETFEKLAAVAPPGGPPVILDFSGLREDGGQGLRTLESAIRARRAVRFTYMNAAGETRDHTVEPVAVVYRWYAWYLLAYSRVRDDYRTYKLARMRSLSVTDEGFSREHADAREILAAADKRDTRVAAEVTIDCRAAARAKAEEYLNGRVVRENSDGDVRMVLRVVEGEPFWFGMLLALGDDVSVVEPEELRWRLYEAAKKITAFYENQDMQLSLFL